MPSAVLTIAESGAANTVSSLSPEARRNLMRTHAEIRMEGDEAVMTIEAADTSAMRAALNSFLECVMITEDIDKITKGTL
jgi:KEOPS complex subunit Pcc1